MSAEADCIFCRIIRGEIPSFKLFEDETTYAFMDINPTHDGHALVIPKEHAANVHAVSDSAIAATAITAKRIAGAIEKELAPGGINLLQCNGSAAAQSVLHFHMHVIPRYEGDELPLNWALRPGNSEALGALAERLRRHLDES